MATFVAPPRLSNTRKDEYAAEPERAETNTLANLDGSSRNDNTTDILDVDAEAMSPISSEERKIRGVRWLLVCFAIFSANVLYGLDTTIVADIQGTVSETFDNVTQLGWLGVGFTLGSTVAILPLGKAYGNFDNKWVFTACLVNFAAASALCGAAPNMNSMVVGRVWAGAGGAGMYLGTLNLPSALCTPKEHPFYVGITGFVYGSGCILGPVVGGALADSSATWRWAFYLNLVIFAAMSPIYIFLVPSIPRGEAPILQKTKAIDWLGIVLNTGVYTSMTLALIFGGAIWPWGDGRVIALLVIFGTLTVAFVITQRFNILTNPEQRLFPCDFLHDKQLILLYIIMACGGGGLFVSVYYIPLFYLFIYGDSGTEAAVRLLPFICLYVVTILACGATMGRTGYHIIWFVVKTSPSNIYGYAALLGLGMATSQAGYAVGAQRVGSSRAAELIQFLNISQGSSQLIGLAIASALFQNYTFNGLKSILAGQEYSDSQIQGAIAGARSDLLASLSPDLRARCLGVIVESIGKCWILVIAAGSCYTLSSCLLTRTQSNWNHHSLKVSRS
ncbi:hypothetical protein KVR01_007182 [Diaporthe batatas]|uniref:uncharacterized protein n=1 Tax=Diaporthe batatas TaxID=748121 RepID=UPI001D054173|nr:uncharacterized protein KVR01_007182 [Diaporthe batatas]KAG8162704.1 hypothetical protein KVR01_007182 [Diaporthe batatas]